MGRRTFIALLFVPALLSPQAAPLEGADEFAAALGREILDSGLDPESCYRARDLSLVREDIKLFFNDGFLIFSKPVRGRRLSAVFHSEEGMGDGEVVLLPPNRMERTSLSKFAGTPNLNEHFRSAVLIFSDHEGERLARELADRRSPEMGVALAQRYNPVARNLRESFHLRLAEDILNEDSGPGLLFLTAVSETQGPFDVMFEPAARNQILAGQIAEKGGAPSYNVWTHFAARSYRNGARQLPEQPFVPVSYRIEAEVSPELDAKVVTEATIRIGSKALGALTFEIARAMRVSRVTVDGQPAAILQRESLRANAMLSGGNEWFLVMPASSLAPRTEHTIRFEHEGRVIRMAGNKVYFVGDRSTWYPRRGQDFATYELTFRYPARFSLVAMGEKVEDRREGDWKILRTRTSVPVRLAGFNFGDYESATVSAKGLTVEAFGNRQVEPALQPAPRQILLPTLPTSPRGPRRLEVIQQPLPPPNPVARLRELASDVLTAFDFMQSLMGPPLLNKLTVSPVTGGFGQGFPGLLYLSTISYLDPSDRPVAVRSAEMKTFFTDLLPAHETAHQWFGNLVTTADYSDDWLMEALANYLALMYVEKKRGPKAMDEMLDRFREHLLAKDADGNTVESSGPITLGGRLESMGRLDAWRTITYEKGAWILHMLRRKMGDERFRKLLAELCQRYRLRPISTEEFRNLAASLLPPKSSDSKLEVFFDQWVYGTGIPEFKVSYTVKGKAPALRVTGTVTQAGVDEDFSADVPVEIVSGKQTQVIWVRTGSEPAPFSVAVKVPGAKAQLGSGVLAVR